MTEEDLVGQGQHLSPYCGRIGFFFLGLCEGNFQGDGTLKSNHLVLQFEGLVATTPSLTNYMVCGT